MLNSFAEAESGLPVLLVHVQKSMPEMFKNMTGKTDIQDMMRNLQIRMTETAKAKKKGGLTCDENLKITHEEEQNNTLLEDLAEMIKKLLLPAIITTRPASRGLDSAPINEPSIPHQTPIQTAMTHGEPAGSAARCAKMSMV